MQNSWSLLCWLLYLMLFKTSTSLLLKPAGAGAVLVSYANRKLRTCTAAAKGCGAERGGCLPAKDWVSLLPPGELGQHRLWRPVTSSRHYSLPGLRHRGTRFLWVENLFFAPSILSFGVLTLVKWSYRYCFNFLYINHIIRYEQFFFLNLFKKLLKLVFVAIFLND